MHEFELFKNDFHQECRLISVKWGKMYLTHFIN